MTTAYDTQASRDAVKAIAALLEALPLALRADVLEEAYGASLSYAVADAFKARYGDDPLPVLLVGGEMSEVMHQFVEATDDL